MRLNVTVETLLTPLDTGACVVVHRCQLHTVGLHRVAPQQTDGNVTTDDTDVISPYVYGYI